MPIITVSGGMESGGVALANMLSERLRYRSFSREILLESAKKYNILEEELQADIEKTPGLLERFTKERNRYVVFIKASLLHAVKQDNVIYHGYAGETFLEGISHVLKIRLEAPFEHRVRAVMDERSVTTREEAEKIVRQADQQRERWLRAVYQRDWHDPALYDIVLNLANMTLETAFDIVAHASSRPDFQATPASIQRLEDFLLESEVMAAFAADDKLHDKGLIVSATAGSVTVRGYVKNKQQTELIEDTVSKVKGVKDHHVYVTLLADGFTRRSP